MRSTILLIITGAVLVLGGAYLATNTNLLGKLTGNSMGDMHMMHAKPTGKDLTKLPEEALPAVKPTEIVELKDGDTFDLTASIVTQEVGNRMVKRLAYNGQIPGPILKVQKGSKITVNFTNNIDMETTVHSHGLRGDWKSDGTPGLSQPPVEIGESFTYELEFPDTGVYWYHPHIREDYQQDLGLYGNFIVEEEGYWNEVDQEEYIVLDDWLTGGNYYDDTVTYSLMGRFGDRLLINDREDFELEVQQGEITRLFITNVANTRTFDLHFPGALIKLVGGDNGRIEHEIETTEIHLAPSERYVIELLYAESGEYVIDHRGQNIGTIKVAKNSANKVGDLALKRDNPTDYQLIRSQFDELLNREPDKKIRLDIEMSRMGNMNMSGMMNQGTDNMTTGTGTHLHQYGIEWEDNMPMMNQMSNDDNTKWIIEDSATKKQNMDINWSFNQGDLVKVEIHNDKNGMHPMHHPIHFHGQRFMVLAVDGVPNDNLQWKDTAIIPAGATVDIIVEMSNPGKWMAHCHIAEHLHSGMMFHFEVN